MVKINVPKILNLDSTVKFFKRLENFSKKHGPDGYIFNFKNMGFIEPFAMIYFSHELKRFRQLFPRYGFTAVNHEKKNYAAHMGLFDCIGISFGKEMGEAKGSKTYIPITQLDVQATRKKAKLSGLEYGEIIEKEAESLAKMLVGTKEEDLNSAVSYSIREIMRNVIEHSQSKVLDYYAQYWPTKDLVEIAILDTGVGIFKTLKRNPHLSINNEREAIQQALLPSVSGKAFKDSPFKQGENWANSGYGLYLTSRFCREGGEFLIISNSQALKIDGKKESFETTYHGTAIRLRIKPSSIHKPATMLKLFNKEGYELAKEIQGSHAIAPSRASSIITENMYTVKTERQ